MYSALRWLKPQPVAHLTYAGVRDVLRCWISKEGFAVEANFSPNFLPAAPQL